MGRILLLPLLLAVLAGVCGCESLRNDQSIVFSDPVFHRAGPICSVLTAPLAGDITGCDCKDLKKGTSSEVVFVQFYYLPLVAVGDESIKSAMRNGGITELYYADYSVRFFLVVGWFTVNAYGK